MTPAAKRTTPGQSPAMVTPPRSRGSRRRSRPTTAARQAHASASAGRHSLGMVTVTHPSSRRSPA
eukprot:12683925-Alexandrium_andersonii.AAC.1